MREPMDICYFNRNHAPRFYISLICVGRPRTQYHLKGSPCLSLFRISCLVTLRGNTDGDNNSTSKCLLFLRDWHSPHPWIPWTRSVCQLPVIVLTNCSGPCSSLGLTRAPPLSLLGPEITRKQLSYTPTPFAKGSFACFPNCKWNL